MGSTALERTRGREASGRHACEGTPRGVTLVEERDGWRVAFARAGTVWKRTITHCPWCGAELARPVAKRTAADREGALREKRRRGGASSMRRVRCVETGETFASQKQAAEAYGVHQASVSSAIGRGCRAGGVHWERA